MNVFNDLFTINTSDQIFVHYFTDRFFGSFNVNIWKVHLNNNTTGIIPVVALRRAWTRHGLASAARGRGTWHVVPGT